MVADFGKRSPYSFSSGRSEAYEPRFRFDDCDREESAACLVIGGGLSCGGFSEGYFSAGGSGLACVGGVDDVGSAAWT